ncbi:MAG: hypothetical protein R3C02_10110 [Planctomycetaceae bacterium]
MANLSPDWSPLRMPLSADAAPVEPTGATRCGLDTLLAIDVILLNRQDVEDAKGEVIMGGMLTPTGG